MASFLDRDHTVARPGFNRWLVPPAALAIHLCIGQAYALSVFNLPMSRLIGITKPAPEDWPLTTTVWIFNIAIFFLGLSAALFGKWLERVGPRRAMFASALCFGGGFLVSALGVHLHQIWLVYLGYGVIGGIGLGLGYISPVSTLIKWFPDRPGMATGMAIMGFGGGAMIGSPLAQNLMEHYSSATSVGVAETFATMGLLYLAFMMFGVFTVRVPAEGWRPEGWVPSQHQKKLVTNANVTADTAIKTPQFWLLWAVLFLNVTAGIGVLAQASPMIQEMFPGTITPAAAAGFVGLLSLFNLAGRFFWSSTSDYIGRKNTYMVYFALGTVLYAAVPTLGRSGSVFLFVAAFCVIMSMYGGGFSTVPAYLRDMFGTLQVGAIHGRLLTAWSAAALVGPTLVTYVRDYQLAHGVPKSEVYTITLYIMAGLLVLGFVANFFVREVNARYHVRTAEPTGAPAGASFQKA
ncbi:MULTISPECIES: OFA family MFS transporter [Myxococcaceae]|uniref:L-lactate MFS transporter n=1 Tax=Myxococcaceae TaxID=31 RepID=UPI001E3CCFCA|nr:MULTISPECIES: OFA family MFS transporter [Myxococcaceae]